MNIQDGEALAVHSDSIKAFRGVQSVVRAVRNTRAEYSVDPKRKIAVHILVRGDVSSYEEESAVIAALAKVSLRPSTGPHSCLLVSIGCWRIDRWTRTDCKCGRLPEGRECSSDKKTST